MAKYVKSLKYNWFSPGFIACGLIIVTLLMMMGGFILSTPIKSLFDIQLTPYLKKVISFSFYQSFLSALLSIIPGYFIAKALYRRDFKLKSLLLVVCSTTLILPSLVVVFGIITLYGNAGLVTQLINLLFANKVTFSIYGLNGILLAHVFFNLPYATLFFLNAFNNISSHQLKLAAQLNFSSFIAFKLIEWPLLKKQATYLFTLIFTLCFSSFSVVLLLGGGPKATTIELAIFQAITYDYDFQKATFLSLIQITICLCLLLISQNLSTHYSNSNDQSTWKLKSNNVWVKFCDFLCITLLILLVLPPIIAIFIAGLNGDFFTTITSATFIEAFKNSIVIGFASALISMLIAISISWTAREFVIKETEWIAKIFISISSAALMIPGVILTTGIYITLFKLDLIQTLLASPFFLIPIINALMALPFVLNLIYTSMLNSAKAYQKLCALYGIKGFNRLWLIDVKGNISIFKKAFAFAFTMSLGDIGVISILGSQSSDKPFLTLPYLLLLKLGTYQSQSADSLALILLCLVLLAFLSINTFKQRN